MIKDHSLGVMALTKKGCALARRVENLVPDRPVTLYLPEKWTLGTEVGYSFFRETVEKALSSHAGVLFIMATGIVVRSIAPMLDSKDKDPAVLVMDEGGVHVISLLSGHLGGANDLARKLGRWLGAQPVITTASDVSDKHAVDVLALKYDLILKDLEGAKVITSLFVNDEPVKVVDPFGYMNKETFPSCQEPKGILVVSSQRNITMDLPFVQLIPKDLVVGLGCRKDIPFETIKRALLETFEENNLDLDGLALMATVDIKAEEAGILETVQWLDITLVVLSRDQLARTEEKFVQSSFVKKTIGTGAVAEPCGYIASKNGTLLVPKTIKDGVTLSIWRRKTNV
ncbi:cobalt-precorrin 5A hydrolase [Alkalibacter rhizosphaerae]|uniref:Cobalt-precorrin 5A hydrolase n=1 Tax=Alkalibacter rhizosphaerae TaxID=2815577 RepID=A0A974XHG7_9FIRM|nr:cobalt-precorrin 5A hydrolase [Alkalibacter rhizosphaerae]QSX08820.1 cobalt-precorrin 5A hydrolase [Alkalibacter rhizosphaerae]